MRCRSLGRARARDSFTPADLLRLVLVLLRHGEVAAHSPAALIHSRRATVDDGAAGGQVDGQALAVDLVLLAIQPNVADQGDELAVEVVDSEIAARGFRWASDDHSV